MFCDVFFTFCDVNVLELLRVKLLRFETITFSDTTLSDLNVVLCYVLSQTRSTPLGKPFSAG